MIGQSRVLALIPARGGSKGLPRKNVLPLLGRPLIGWTIEQAKQSRYIDRVVVSTDDFEIAEAGRASGGDVPFMRPAELASDTASSIDVILHALDTLGEAGDHYEYLALLEPTSPLRDSSDIDAALEQLVSTHRAESIVGVAKVESAHPDFLVRIEGGFAKPFAVHEIQAKRRQELDELYFFEGSLYIAAVNSLRARRSFYHSATLPYVVPKFKAYEIDDPSDFIVVEALMRARLEGRL
jgi:CMP-N,N'-diacetyllegionaminic acid synthase